MLDEPTTNGHEPTRTTTRGGWSDVEEARLVKIVLAMNLRSGRTTTEQWEAVAEQLARDGATLGFPQRSGSSCRHRAQKLGVYQHDREEPLVKIPTRASFAPLEVKLVLADALEAVARTLRGS